MSEKITRICARSRSLRGRNFLKMTPDQKVNYVKGLHKTKAPLPARVVVRKQSPVSAVPVQLSLFDL
jgi:hypothetical protein